jgi:chromosome segregation ATPase
VLGEATQRQNDLAERLDAAATDLAAARSAAEVAAEAVAGGDNLRKALAATEAEKGELALRLAALEDDLDALRAENAELRRVAGAEWESDREEGRRLRERLGEIAAGVVRLTQSLEGIGGSASDAASPATPTPLAPVQRPTLAPVGGETGDATLAERLRALQHAARH